MLRLATARFSDMVVSDIELTRPGPSYTVDTLIFYSSMNSRIQTIFFWWWVWTPFWNFDTWKRWETIPENPLRFW